jgi:2-amino-4-hydroxy-6-hydroxymethyldihydropteridine diphosphokinase
LKAVVVALQSCGLPAIVWYAMGQVHVELRLRRMVLGLGSNLGDRAGNIARAVNALAAAEGVRLLGTAPLYETPPFGGPAQGDYLNSAALVETALAPREVLALALDVERSLGRLRPDPVRWGPRTIDIDLLWIEGTTVDEPGLVVPHPGLTERPFAVRPLVDVAPDAADPRTGMRYAELPAATGPIHRFADAIPGAGRSAPAE